MCGSSMKERRPILGSHPVEHLTRYTYARRTVNDIQHLEPTRPLPAYTRILNDKRDFDMFETSLARQKFCLYTTTRMLLDRLIFHSIVVRISHTPKDCSSEHCID